MRYKTSNEAFTDLKAELAKLDPATADRIGVAIDEGVRLMIEEAIPDQSKSYYDDLVKSMLP